MIKALSSDRFRLAVLLALMSGSAVATDILLLAGYSGSKRGTYGYLGAVMPISSPYLYKDGWLLRLWVAQADFTYLSVLGRETKGRAPELEASLGYLKYLGDKNNRLTVYLGGVHRNGRLRPDDPFSNIEHRRNGIRIQGDLSLRPIETFDFSMMASNTARIEDKWLRLRPGYVIQERIVLGPELVFLRGEAYSRKRVGISLESVPLGRNAVVAFSVGREKDRVQGSASYAGMSLISWF